MAGGIERIRDQLAAPVAAPDLRRQAEPDKRVSEPTLPPGCPVTPLGIQGVKIWVLDRANQMISMATDCRKGDLILIFGGDDWLMEKFPQFREKKGKNGGKPEFEIVGFNQAHVQSALVTACHRRGIFDPIGRVFGRGAHRGGPFQTELVLHMGASVLVSNGTDHKGKAIGVAEYPAGEIGDAFYPAYNRLPAPAAKPSSQAEAIALLELFGKWHWVGQRTHAPDRVETGLDPDPSPLLLLGMVAQMFICGALEWRSHVWLAGPTAAGKSSLQAVIRAILAKWCLHTEDASEAAIRQVLKDDTLPVMIDEAEADDNPERQRAILNLMKKASSGGKLHRGSSDHKAQEFTAQSCFLLSSVLHGLVKGEERNRVAILDMMQIPLGKTQWEAPDLAHWQDVGRRMHRRMIEQWPRFARTLADYKREIWSHGLEGRWQDTFGTLLACADCLLFEDAPSRESELNPEHGREKIWVRAVLPMMLHGKGEARTDVDRCIAFLMSRLIPGANGKAPEAIGQWIMRAMTVVGVVTDSDEDGKGVNEYARDRLKSYGLRVSNVIEGDKGWKPNGDPLPNEEGWRDGYLLVAYATCAPLSDLFRDAGGREWAGGGWLQSLGKIEGVRKGAAMKARFAGSPDNCIAVPLKALWQWGER